MRLKERLASFLGGIPPAVGLSQDRTAGGLLLSIWEGALYTVITSLIGGQYLAGFALALGAGTGGVAVLTALPALAGGVQVLAGPYLAARFRRVPVIAAGGGLHRIGWGLGGLLLLALPRELWVFAYAAVLFLAHAVQFASVPAWWSLLSDLADGRLRGRYFGLRNAVLSAAGIAAVLGAGLILDRFKGLSGFWILHGAAAALGLLNLRLLLAHPEPTRRATQIVPVSAPLANRAFLLIAGFVGLWMAAQGVAAPLYSITMLKLMRLPYSTISWLMVTMALAATLSLLLWGPLCDRMGAGRVVSWLAPVAASVPLGWLLAPASGVVWLFALHAMLGAGNAGIILALGNINLGVAGDGPGRAAYIAMFSTVSNVAAGIGPLIGGAVGRPSPAFLASGIIGWGLWGIWWFWYRPSHLLAAARRQADPGPG